MLKIILVVFMLKVAVATDTSLDEFEENFKYIIEGKVFPPEMYMHDDWQREIVILLNGGDYKGFLREDGTFVISSIESGSYVVEVINSNYVYEPVRVEINPKGKFRARKLNFVQPSQVIQVPYPLKLKALVRHRYFQQREQWKITDFLFNPMVIIMVFPLILMLVLPKMMSDPETKKEMEQLNLNKMTSDMPEISEMITSFFTGQPATVSKSDKVKTSSKQNKKRL